MEKQIKITNENSQLQSHTVSGILRAHERCDLGAQPEKAEQDSSGKGNWEGTLEVPNSETSPV